jgi:AcrR family transcriptional regulator
MTTPASSSPTGSGDQPLRVDAERNRARIIAAAHEVLAEQGLDASMNEIAKRAGVGIATLFRRFPTRDELFAATFAPEITAYADAIDAALADQDPWHGFCTYIERVCAMQAADHGFANVLTLTFPQAKAFQSERDRAYHGFVELIRRAQQSGDLRPDFVPEDLVLLLMANAGLINATAEAAPNSWRRLVAYLIQAFAVEAAKPLPDPPTPQRMYRALCRSHSKRNT